MLGGILANKFGPKIILFFAVLFSSLISIFSPAMARFNVLIFILIRALLGFTQGVIFPAMHSFLSGWAPPLERGILTGISYAGAQIGNMLVMPLSGILCKYGIDGGWPSIFYLFGIIGLFWCLIWFLISSDSPQKHKTIKIEEKEYILKSLGKNNKFEIKKNDSIPIYSILTSKPVWAIFIGHFAGDWGSYTMALGIPSFLNDVLGLNLTSMGIISALPYFAYFLFINIGGYFADKLQQKKIFSTLNCRRLAMLIAFGGQAIMLIAIGYCDCNQHNLVIILLILSTGISGFQYSGFVINYMDICPELSGFVLGIGNTLSCLAGLISPIIMGWLTPTGSKEEWLIVFYITSFILIFGALIFSIFASAEIQEWAKNNPSKKQQNCLEQQKLPILENNNLIKNDLKENIINR
ncbi:MFS domain-containing protein [Meloidogyne graminicola]|uniref:MFS domain-containing protein n=1 Tax=Meloidogyne graminicola TaxID=189291 RepID=A0A8S9ZYM6_9BILA|nr:MFS domain-containing protein [Meloidogyne graminicola]